MAEISTGQKRASKDLSDLADPVAKISKHPTEDKSGKMKEAHVHADTSVTLHDVPIPEIKEPSQIIIRVVCSGINPKDWKMPAGILTTIRDCPNSGDNIAGIVHEIGTGVTGFRKGDRVAALHPLRAPGGSSAEYAIANDFSTFHIPEGMSFEEAATVPMVSLMACIGLFAMLRVAAGPHGPLKTPRPLLIYGASSSVGAMAVKLAQLSNIHALICLAGGGALFVQTLISPEKGDTIVSYRDGP